MEHIEQYIKFGDKSHNFKQRGRKAFVELLFSCSGRLGDFNENLLKYNEDKQTSEDLDMLLSLGFMPIITKQLESRIIPRPLSIISTRI